MTLSLGCRPASDQVGGFMFTQEKFDHLESPQEIPADSVWILLKRPSLWTGWRDEKAHLLERAFSSVDLKIDDQEPQDEPTPVDPQGALFQSVRANFRGQVGTACESRGVHYRFWDFRETRPDHDKSFIAWAKDGALVDYPVIFSSHHFALQVVVSADHLETDLTGWQLRHQPGDQERLCFAADFALAFLKEKLDYQADEMDYPRDLLKARRRGAVTGGVLLAASGLAIYGLSPSHMALAYELKYHLWSVGQWLMAASPYLSGFMGLCWLSARTTEKRIVTSRRDDLRLFAAGWARRVREWRPDDPLMLEAGLPFDDESMVTDALLYRPTAREMLAERLQQLPDSEP